MKNNQPVTQTEHPMREGSILVSQTDLKGRITDCNKDFEEISGFNKAELIGKAHNIVRHPDMPPAAFEDLWRTVQRGKPWTGIVKNRCKNGDYYWVKANVTPLFENGRLSGYMSVRTAPSREEISAADRLYREINAGQATLKRSGFGAWLKTVPVRRLLMGAVFVTVSTYGAIAAMLALGVSPLVETSVLGAIGLLTLVGGLLLTRHITAPLGYVERKMRQLAEGHYFDWVETDRDDEFGRMMQALKMAQIKLGFEVVDARVKALEGARIQYALDNVSTPVTVSDDRNKLIYLNNTARDLFNRLGENLRQSRPGFSADQLIGTSLADFLPDDRLKAAYRTQLTAPRTSELKAWDRQLKVITSPVYNEDHVYQGRVTQWLDITDEQAVEHEIDSIVAAAKTGDLTQRISLESKQGFYRSLAENINALIDVIAQGFEDIATAMAHMAKGDLTQPITNEYHGTFGKVKQDVNTTMANLEEIITKLRAAGDVIHHTANEINQGNTDLSARTEQQATALEQTAASMEEITGTVKNNADNARDADQLASSARKIAEQGGEVVKRAVQAMSDITASSNKIAEIISVIDEIAFQTNLLALNASVEAAHAGEQGKGFAVVATEVRDLAGRSAEAAKEIKDLISDSARKVEAGTSLVNESGETLDSIVDEVKRVVQIISEIAAAGQEQAIGIELVNQSMNQLDQVTQQNTALAQKTSRASSALSQKVQEMDRLVSFFTLSRAPESHRVKLSTPAPAALPGPAASQPAPAPMKKAVGDDWDAF
ncbi:MAG TPA: PAS domain S-box protein [Gammaproteobacteria bacterium]|nr:PAS domain S-box protein [Gammaproteobacteria bacterium]